MNLGLRSRSLYGSIQTQQVDKSFISSSTEFLLSAMFSKCLCQSSYSAAPTKKEMGKKMDLDEERETLFFCEQVKRYLQLFLNLEMKLWDVQDDWFNLENK